GQQGFAAARRWRRRAVVHARNDQSLWRFWDFRGHASEGARQFDAVLRLAESEAVSTQLRVRALIRAGSLHRLLAEHEQATTLAQGAWTSAAKSANNAKPLRPWPTLASLPGTRTTSRAHDRTSKKAWPPFARWVRRAGLQRCCPTWASSCA